MRQQAHGFEGHPLRYTAGLTEILVLDMNDVIVWVIIAAFYAPLHYLLPVLFLFITGREDDDTRGRLIRSALVDSTVSMVVAFAVVIWLATAGHLFPAMVILLMSMGFPFIRIWRHRREIEGIA
jgi:hypothetical protein